MSEKRVLRIGIASYEDMKARTMAIARGEWQHLSDEPKIWFTSLESMAQVLSKKNCVLLDIIAKKKPSSLKELADLSKREKSNLSRTLKTMESYGLVVLARGSDGHIVPRIAYDTLDFHCQLKFAS